MTDLVYLKDSYIFECETTVLSCEQSSELFNIELAQTPFFPESCGVCSDIGFIDKAHVSHVKKSGGKILHACETPFSGGQKVIAKVESIRRLELMRTHSAEHLLSGLLENYGIGNIGFALTPDHCTLDTNIVVPPDVLEKIEARANEIVLENRSIYCSSDAKKTKPRKAPEKENLRIIVIDGVDACGCNAPHVKSTGEIGAIKILRCDVHRGGSRLSICAGMSAYSEFAQTFDIVRELQGEFSSSTSDLVRNILSMKLALRDIKTKNGILTGQMAKIIAPTIPKKSGGYFYIVPEFLGENGARELCALLSQDAPAVVIMKKRYFIAGENAREICKKANELLSGKGGGRDMCEGIIANFEPEHIEAIVSAIFQSILI